MVGIFLIVHMLTESKICLCKLCGLQHLLWSLNGFGKYSSHRPSKSSPPVIDLRLFGRRLLSHIQVPSCSLFRTVSKVRRKINKNLPP